MPDSWRTNPSRHLSAMSQSSAPLRKRPKPPSSNENQLIGARRRRSPHVGDGKFLLESRSRSLVYLPADKRLKAESRSGWPGRTRAMHLACAVRGTPRTSGATRSSNAQSGCIPPSMSENEIRSNLSPRAWRVSIARLLVRCCAPTC